MECRLDKVPLEIAVGDIENYVADNTVTDNISFMQHRVYEKTAKILKDVIDVVSAQNADMESQKVHIPTVWVMTALSEIGKNDVKLSELFPSEWASVVAGIVYHELYAEYTGVVTDTERQKIIYGILNEMSGIADITVHEVMSAWLGYSSEWETARGEVMKVVSVLAGPETAPNTPGNMEEVTFTSERACVDFGIPTPLEMRDLRGALGYEATLEEMLAEYRVDPTKYSLSIKECGTTESIETSTEITTTEIPSIDNVEPVSVVPTETKSVGNGVSTLQTMLEEANRAHLEAVNNNSTTATSTAEQINNSELNRAEIEAKIESLNAATPAYYSGGGGGSSSWTTSEIVVTTAALVVLAAGAWYGYRTLTSDYYDINLSDFKVPDFAMPDFDY